jgi:hypothetical protein
MTSRHITFKHPTPSSRSPCHRGREGVGSWLYPMTWFCQRINSKLHGLNLIRVEYLKNRTWYQSHYYEKCRGWSHVYIGINNAYHILSHNPLLGFLEFDSANGKHHDEAHYIYLVGMRLQRYMILGISTGMFKKAPTVPCHTVYI